MWFTCVEFNTDENGESVPMDISEEEQPKCYFGPFANYEKAMEWVTHGYPEDDTDVREIYAFEAETIEELGYVNGPLTVISAKG